jgi:type IX secretion system PorP/SprF family membrane protein
MQGFKHVLSYFFMFLLMTSINVELPAQQMPGLSLYHLNSLYYNPAAAGAGRDAYVQAHYRNQWTSYETSQDGNGNLGTSIVGVSLPLNFQHLGMGLIVMNDKTPSGVGQQVIRLQLAYHYPMATGAQISLGLGFGMQSKSFDGRIFRVRDANDPLAVELSGKQVSQAIPDFNAGLMYTSDRVEVGFGSPTLKLKNELAANMHVKANLTLNDRFEWSPFAQLNYYNGVLLPQLGAKVIFQQQFWVGAGYRWDDAATMMAGVSFLNNRLDLAYAMDLSVINSAVKSNLSHEVLLRFVLPSFQTASRFVPIKTPRFK